LILALDSDGLASVTDSARGGLRPGTSPARSEVHCLIHPIHAVCSSRSVLAKCG
jgi:hypothetical protein